MKSTQRIESMIWFLLHAYSWWHALYLLLQAGKLMCRGIYPLSTDTPYIYLYTAGSAVTHMSS